tara:strand:- start:153 stop:608 length:456 start_codon:yes stop_codon:yes gene_type:complete
MTTSLCCNSFPSEVLAFKKLGFARVNQVADEQKLSTIYPRQKVPDSIFSTTDGNVAVEVKRIKNVMHKDTVLNALSKVHHKIVQDFNIKVFHIVFLTRETGKRDKVNCVTRDVHGIMKKHINVVPYKLNTGPHVFVHVIKANSDVFRNIGF